MKNETKEKESLNLEERVGKRINLNVKIQKDINISYILTTLVYVLLLFQLVLLSLIIFSNIFLRHSLNIVIPSIMFLQALSIILILIFKIKRDNIIKNIFEVFLNKSSDSSLEIIYYMNEIKNEIEDNIENVDQKLTLFIKKSFNNIENNNKNSTVKGDLNDRKG